MYAFEEREIYTKKGNRFRQISFFAFFLSSCLRLIRSIPYLSNDTFLTTDVRVVFVTSTLKVYPPDPQHRETTARHAFSCRTCRIAFTFTGSTNRDGFANDGVDQRVFHTDLSQTGAVSNRVSTSFDLARSSEHVVVKRMNATGGWLGQRTENVEGGGKGRKETHTEGQQEREATHTRDTPAVRRPLLAFDSASRARLLRVLSRSTATSVLCYRNG